MILNLNRIKSKLGSNNLKSSIKSLFSASLLIAILVSSHSTASDEAVKAKYALKFDTANHYVISSSKSNISIVVGESLRDQQIRMEKEKAELAKRQAEEATKKRIASIARDISRSAVSENIDLIPIYKNAAQAYGLTDWRYLQAVHKIETGCAIVQLRQSSAGARGPMQFLPSTWRSWGADGDGDGVADIDNVVDAIHGAARYLSVCGGQTDIRKALFSYNHSTSYVNRVVAIAESITVQ